MGSNVTKKFQDHAEYRKGWEPYENLGVNKVDPQDLEQLLAFNELANDPEQFDNWLRSAAEERGLFEQAQPEEDLYGNPYADEAAQQVNPDQIQQMIAEQIGPLYEQAQAQQEQAAIQEATENIQSQLDGLHEKHGDFPDEIICQLAMAYETPDGIAQAFGDYQNLIAQTERGVVEQKLAEPSSPESGGTANTVAPQDMNWETAREAAIARLKANNQ